MEKSRKSIEDRRAEYFFFFLILRERFTLEKYPSSVSFRYRAVCSVHFNFFLNVSNGIHDLTVLEWTALSTDSSSLPSFPHISFLPLPPTPTRFVCAVFGWWSWRSNWPRVCARSCVLLLRSNVLPMRSNRRPGPTDTVSLSPSQARTGRAWRRREQF